MQADRLPDTENALVLRTDFTDDGAWQSVCAEIEKPQGDFQAYVEFVSDKRFEGATVEQLLALQPNSNYRSFMFVVDGVTIASPDRAILVIDLTDEPGRTFRVAPSEMWGVEHNLSLANLDFRDFAESAGNDGIFRGFPEA
jgi:hypothetical protein